MTFNKSGIDKIKKALIVIVVAAIAAELIWAISTLSQVETKKDKKPQDTQEVKIPAQLTDMPAAVMSLKAPKKSIKIGETIPVTIEINSIKQSDGADIIISYDPNLVTVVKAGKPLSPIIKGDLYESLPLNDVDEKKGLITVSAVASSGGSVLADGIFGFINFKAKSAGKAKVTIQFSGPGDTRDSNVIEAKTSVDMLDRVDNLELNILP